MAVVQAQAQGSSGCIESLVTEVARVVGGMSDKEFSQWISDHPEFKQVASIVRVQALVPTSPSLREGCVRLRHQSGGFCDVSTYGAHLLSWQPEHDKEQVFLADMAQIGKAGVAIRGGVPICWPQFGGFENAAGAPRLKHGFARTSCAWTLARRTEDSATFSLSSDEETRARWPHTFQCLYTVSVGSGSVRMEMEVQNGDETPLEFTGCLHSYWRCASSERCSVEGLRGARYDRGIGDSFRGDAVEDRASVPFTDAKETQLLYADAGDAVTLVEDGRPRLRITKSNVSDWVIWNTGAENGSGLKDLREGEYKTYVCIEPTFASRPVRVAPGASWVASHEARVL